jgi:hypothetical protein
MARRGLAALAVCLGLLAASGTGTSAAPAACQLGGSWSQTTTDVGSTTWSIRADGKAQEQGIGNASGTASLSGNILTITWTTSDGYAGVYRWTLDAQCNGSGMLTFTKVGPGDPRQGQSFASTVDGPPPVKAPGCGSAASVRSARAAPDCTVTRRKEPGPGGSVAASSPKLASGATTETVSVSSSAGDLTDSTIVAEAERKRTKRKKIVEEVTACVLLGPDAIENPNEGLKLWLATPGVQAAIRRLSLEETLALCIYAVKRNKTASEPASTSSAKAGCRSHRIVLDVRRNLKGRITSVKLGRSRAKVRYGCSSNGGATTITAKAPGGLRGAVGSRLDVGLVRHPNAPRRSAQLTFGFAAR